MADPSATALQTLKDEHTKVQARFDQVQQLYEQLVDIVEPSQLPLLEAKLDELLIQKSDITQKVLSAIAATQTPTPAATIHTVGQKPKILDALKPFKLKADNHPADLRSWMDKFCAYYTSSGLAVYTTPEQHALLFNCINQDLETKIKEHDDYSPDLPVFSDNDNEQSIFYILEKEFLLTYPLFTRRYHFFSMKQVPGQLFTDYMTKLKQKGDEADLHKLDIDEIYVFRYITSVTDSKLRERFLKLQNPTLENLKREARAYEVSIHATNALDNKGRSFRTKETKGKFKNIPRDWKNRSLRCGSQNHKANNCKKDRNQLQCSHCKINGHATSVCLKKFKSESRPASRMASRAPSPTPPATPEPQPSTSMHRLTGNILTLKEASENVRALKPTPDLRVHFRSIDGKTTFSYNACSDTGATHSFISANIIARYRLDYNANKKVSLGQVNGAHLDCKGCIQLFAQCPSGPEAMIEAVISGDAEDLILISWHDLQNLGVIPRNFPSVLRYTEEQRTQAITALRNQFRDVLGASLDENKFMKGPPMHIHLTDARIRPKQQTCVRQIPLHWQEEAKTVISNLVAQGILVPVTEPTDWISPGHFVADYMTKLKQKGDEAFLFYNTDQSVSIYCMS